ncbi:unnamed protein product [Ilex paraguariensis]|uniref:Uncharacterized protein n=1 Tax=Ilex paraguariensis TaxID=185542 RepID=A0ABC8R827_9AQUA
MEALADVNPLELESSIEGNSNDAIKKKDTGYTVYYMLPDADSEDSLRQLASDNNVLNLFACYEGNDIIRLYVVTEQINEGSKGISTVGDKFDTPTFDYEFSTEYGSTFCDGLPDTVVRFVDLSNDLSDLDFLYFYDGVPDGVHSSGLENRSRVDKRKSKIGEECSGVERGNSFDKGKAKLNDCLSDEDNDHLYSPLNSDDDVIQVKYQEFMETTDMSNPKLTLGMIFSSATIFRMALRQHAIMDGFDFKYLRNNGDSLVVGVSMLHSCRIS